MAATANLWQRAIQSLPPETIKDLDPAKTGKRDVALAALKLAEEKRLLSLKRRWRVRRLSGNGEIIIRDVVEKIVHWIQVFKQVGDTIMQYDPVHAALPWAAYRFVLQSAINDTMVHGDMVHDLEMVARLMARFHELERIYLSGSAAINDQLGNALVRVYAAILQFLAKAVKLFSDSTTVRLLEAQFRLVDRESRDSILTREAEVLKIASLMDAERFSHSGNQVSRLADLALDSQQDVQKQQYLDIATWLSTLPYLHHHESHQDSRVPGTGQWLLQHPDFTSWAASSSCTALLVHGIPGSGKTNICTAFIDKYLEDMVNMPNLASLAYFYCNAAISEPERRTPEGVLRSLVRQLTVSKPSSPAVHSAVLAMYNKELDTATKTGFQKRKPKLPDCIQLILAALDDNPAILVIDALDEVEQPKKLVDALEKIIHGSRNVVKILVTSRDHPATFAMFSSAETIRITEDQNRADIQSYAAHAVNEAISDHNLLMGNVRDELKQKLVESLVAGAGEMFLWVKLQLLRLCAIEHEKDMTTVLDTISKSPLDELYQEAYGRLREAGPTAHDIAIRSFTWLLYAKETLTVDAFLLAIAASAQISEIDIQNLLRICRGFLQFDHCSNSICFAHHSVREFLQLQELLRPGPAHYLLATTCLYICKNPPPTDMARIAPIERVYNYAALYCGDHCYSAQTFDYLEQSGALAQELKTFLFNEDGTSALIWMDNLKIAYECMPNENPQKDVVELVINERFSPLFPICAFGLHNLLNDNSWPADYDWNQRNDHGHTALYAASFFGHSKIVTSLLRYEADSNVQCGRLGSALHCAAYRGHVAVVKALLNIGADMRVGGKFDSAIQAACRGGREDVVLTILESMEIENLADQEATMEMVAEAGFFKAMMKLQENRYTHTTSVSDQKKIATRVIMSGKVQNLKYLIRTTPLCELISPGSVALSALHGHDEMTEYLLDQGQDIAEVGDLGTPLRCAALSGISSVCHLLLSRGADVNGAGRFGNALHAASMKGFLHIMKSLLDSGADANVKGGFYGTSLQAACYQGHKEAVSLLIAAGADWRESGFARDAFHAAVEGGHHEIVQLLLSHGFKIHYGILLGDSNPYDIPFSKGNLLRASSPSRRGQLHSRREGYGTGLKPKGYDLHGEQYDLANPDDLGNSTPHAKAYAPDEDDRRSYLDGVGKHYPLEAAAALGYTEVVSEILAQREFLDLGSSAMNAALTVACRAGHHIVIETILSRMEKEEIIFPQILGQAATSNDTAIVRMLLDHDHASKNIFHPTKASLASTIGSPSVFSEVLQIIEKKFSKTEVNSVLLDCLPLAAEADRADTMQIILAQGKVDRMNIITALRKASMKGKAAAVRLLYEALLPEGISSGKLSAYIRLAIENGRLEVIQYLLPQRLKHGNIWHFQRLILVAAGKGYLDILEYLLTQSEAPHARTLQQALNLAAQDGHTKVCAYLLSIGVKPCSSVSEVTWGDVALDRGEFRHEDDDASDDEAQFEEEAVVNAGGRQGEKPREELGQGNAFIDKVASSLLSHKLRPLNAIESCLAGFKRFFCAGYLQYIRRPWGREASQEEQASTLRSLLNDVESLEGRMWHEAICFAASCCPPDVIVIMMDKGVDSMACCQGLSALNFGVARECLCFPVVEELFQRAGNDAGEAEIRQLLAQAISFFHEFQGHPELQYALLSRTESLSDAFTTGPGAVVDLLIRHLKSLSAKDSEYSVILQCAAADGRIDLVRLLLHHGVDVNRAGSYYGTALQAASRFGHHAIVKLLLENGADPNIRQGRHRYALPAAVLSENLDVVELLLKTGADTELSANYSHWIKEYKEDDVTALQLAVKHDLSDIARTLITAGASINIEGTDQQPMLIQACQKGNLSLVEALLDGGAHVQTLDHNESRAEKVIPEQRSALHAAIDVGSEEIIQLLLKNGHDLYTNFDEPDNPLTFAARKGNVSVVDILVRQNPAIPGSILFASLDAAINWSNVAIFLKLLDHGSSVLSVDKIVSLLRSACTKGDTDILEALLEEMSRRNQLESIGNSVLQQPPTATSEVYEMILEYVPCTVDLFVECCVCGYDKIVQVGLDQGILATAVDTRGRPALHFAAIQGWVAVLELLLRSGADPNAHDASYGIPLVASLERYVLRNLTARRLSEDLESYAMLLTGEKDDQSRVPRGKYRGEREPSYLQARRLMEVVQLLLDKGASPNPEPGVFGSALTLAAFSGVRSVFEMISRAGASPSVVEYLQSPIAESIRVDHINLAKETLQSSSSSNEPSRRDGSLLLVACETGNLPTVKLLLQEGTCYHAENSEGETPLLLSLAKLAKSHHTDVANRESIVNLLLDTDTTSKMTNRHFVAATTILDRRARNQILRKMLFRAENKYFPKEGFVNLLEHERSSQYDKNGLILQILAEKRIQRITTSMLTATDETWIVEKLLDYDDTCTVTCGALNTFAAGNRRHGRDIAEILLRRDVSFVPSESNVVRVLQASSAFTKAWKTDDYVWRGKWNNDPHILDVMFTRNPQLKVSELMLMVAKHAHDLKVLLSHTTPEDGLVTPTVVERIAMNLGKQMKLVLEFDKKAVISQVTIEVLLKHSDWHAVEILWSHDPFLYIPEKDLIRPLAVFRVNTTTLDDFLKLLLAHRGMFTLTEKWRHAVDMTFPNHGDADIRRRCHSIADAQ